MKKVISISMLIVGTIIGAGFASGRELVSFFGSDISIIIAFLCGGAIFALCYLFLYVGSITNARNVSELNVKLIGKFHFIPDCFLLVNSLIVLSGMLAGMDALGNSYIKLAPLFSILAAVLCAFVVHRGISGILKCNNIIVPFIIFVIIIVTFFALFKFGGEAGSMSFMTLPRLAVYVSMNMILASTVLTSLGKLTKKEMLLSSFLAAVIMTILMLFLILTLNIYGDKLCDMPILDIARLVNPALGVVMAAVVCVSIFTTMIAALSGLCNWFRALLGEGIFCEIIVLLAAFIASRVGFSKVVTLFYPVIGALGLVYIVLVIVYAARENGLAKPLKTPFKRAYNKVHKRG